MDNSLYSVTGCSRQERACPRARHLPPVEAALPATGRLSPPVLRGDLDGTLSIGYTGMLSATPWEILSQLACPRERHLG